MGSCFSKPTADDPPSLDTRDVISQEPSSSQPQRGARPEHELAQVIDESPYGGRRTRDRAHSTSHKAPPMNDVELPPLPQRTRAKSSVDSSSSCGRPNPDQRPTNAGECDHSWARGPSLTMTRALEDCSQTNCNESSRPPTTRLYSAEGVCRRHQVRHCVLPHYLSHNSCI
jgi:hypothetical protein